MKPLISVCLVSALLLGTGCSNSVNPVDTDSEVSDKTPSDQTLLLSGKEEGDRTTEIQSGHPKKSALASRGDEIQLSTSPADLNQTATGISMGTGRKRIALSPEVRGGYQQIGEINLESYNSISENIFKNSLYDPLSTFSIDVDSASYANIRRFIENGNLPPIGAVRVEEMINYFHYSYPQPSGQPFAISTEVGPSPWHEGHRLVRIGIQGKDVAKPDLPPANLVFLIDVSGSMQSANKLPLLKKSMKMLVEQLDSRDRVAIVVYAGSDRIVLSPTSGSAKKRINDAIDSLTSGGSTYASQGIVTAYDLAGQTFMPSGNNRIILASDGDFNVGITSRGELQKLIEEKRQSGIYLTVLGFGRGNYHDDAMELLADKGNGNYGYIDTLLEAKKIMVRQMSGTMYALAKDVKIQVEFNPQTVGAYRLIGYENRLLENEEFRDDTKDAGEIGVGHQVTALYEIIGAGHDDIPAVDQLKYQKPQTPLKADIDELLTIKLRYKPPHSEISVLFQTSVKDHSPALVETSDDFRFAAAVAGYGMSLKGSAYLGKATLSQLTELARGARGNDRYGYRAECIRLMEMTELLRM